jgi:hypothetical protein
MMMTAMTNAAISLYVQRVHRIDTCSRPSRAGQNLAHAAGDHTYARPYNLRRGDSSGGGDIQYILNEGSKQNKYCVVRSVRDVS